MVRPKVIIFEMSAPVEGLLKNTLGVSKLVKPGYVRIAIDQGDAESSIFPEAHQLLVVGSTFTGLDEIRSFAERMKEKNPLLTVFAFFWEPRLLDKAPFDLCVPQFDDGAFTCLIMEVEAFLKKLEGRR